MSEITEEQAREADERLKDEAQYGDVFEHGRDEEIVLDWARQELSRREAGRAERGKPIDAPLGTVCEDERFRVEHRIIGVNKTGVLVTFKQGEWGELELPWINTRGQLLDLLAALKGGG